METQHVRMARPLACGFIESLAARFGPACQTSEAIRAQHGASESQYSTVLPDAVVFAISTQDVVDCVNLCRDAGVAIVPYGAGTSLEGHTLPLEGGVSLDLTRMDAVLSVNHADFDCTVQPGIRREALNTHLRDSGLFFPIDPGANATIGGMASTRASGTNAVRYGTMREAVLGLEVVTPQGKVIRTGTRAKKSAAGYDLTRLYIGSEGTLGVITAVTLRLHPVPEAIMAATCPFESLAGAIETVVGAFHCSVPMARIELLDSMQIRAVNLRSKLGLPEAPTLFFEFHGTPAGVTEQVETVRALAAGNGGGEFQWATHAEDRSRLWRARHESYYAAVNLRPGAIGLTTDVCVPMSRLAECILATRADLDKCSVPATILGHVGDGNFHLVFSIDPNAPHEMAEVEAVNHRMVARALAMDGTCTGEHGVGYGKQQCLVDELGEDAVQVMRTIKQAMDPQNLFNPGKIFRL
ncbi:FAD-binding oxidoreductase [Novosphingobium taihuense]|uniref:D-lactate dehydrogenase (cytochrome) n=1 Tax=Novosphingobium taihuense TaxID=260085 RepID=A0A7W7A9S1_9SPHN|nr:FAD-linked oxidase C-terminal domain-containing protein [Novosphingobium taihuense]MBB4613075.1 D-lactate dehydrogenase (cytochrome) [Novosphingobium taihuense]TWH85218.1 D-lactate dehydrogenase (cytochrome) [Novosphingobium taihuense]